MRYYVSVCSVYHVNKAMHTDNDIRRMIDVHGHVLMFPIEDVDIIIIVYSYIYKSCTLEE